MLRISKQVSISKYDYSMNLESKSHIEFMASFSEADEFNRLIHQTKFTEDEVKEVYFKFKQKTKGQMYLDQASFYELIFFGHEEVGVISDRIFKSIDRKRQGKVYPQANLDQLSGVFALFQYSNKRRSER